DRGDQKGRGNVLTLAPLFRRNHKGRTECQDHLGDAEHAVGSRMQAWGGPAGAPIPNAKHPAMFAYLFARMSWHAATPGDQTTGSLWKAPTTPHQHHRNRNRPK